VEEAEEAMGKDGRINMLLIPYCIIEKDK